MKGYKSVEICGNEDRPFDAFAGQDVVPVAIELKEGAECLTQFEHPENAVYVFGPEDGSIYSSYIRLCHRFVFIPSHHCLNLSAAINVVLYDRRMKRQLAGIEPLLPMDEMLNEERRGEAATLDSIGWSGK